jgi:PAS domain S-box-containing protein
MVSGKIIDREGIPCLLSVTRDITERTRIEASLRESESRFRTLFQTMVQGVVYQDAEGRIVSANPAAERILGLTQDQLMGRTSLDPRWRTIHSDGSDFPGKDHPAMVALRTGKPVLDVVMGIYHPGEERHRWALVSAIPEFQSGESRPFRVYATITDITEQKRIQDELKVAEGRLQTVVSNSQAVIYQLDNEGCFTLSEGLGLEGLGLHPGQAVGLKAVELYAGHPQIVEQVQRALAGESVRGITEVGGMTFDHLLTPVLDARGRVQSVIGIATDITARKQAEDALKERESRLRTITENAPDTILQVDRNGCIQFVNRPIPGLTEEDILGSHVTRWVPESQRELVCRYLEDAFEKGESREYESDGPGPGGLTNHYTVRMQPTSPPASRPRIRCATARHGSGRCSSTSPSA